MKKFTKKYMKLRKEKYPGEDEPLSMPETEHCWKEIKKNDEIREEYFICDETPRKSNLIETIEKVLLAREIKQQQQQQLQQQQQQEVQSKLKRK